jgi:hypothetical protein
MTHLDRWANYPDTLESEGGGYVCVLGGLATSRKTLPFSAMSRAKAADMACAERSEAGESVAKLLRNRVLLSPYESGAYGART